MTIWDNLRHLLGSASPYSQRFNVDRRLVRVISELAEQEQRSENEVVAEMLHSALALRALEEQRCCCWQYLTQREQEVTALVCRGYTNQQIADLLVISPQTVKAHVHNALQKFGLRRKIELYHELRNWDFSEWEARLNRGEEC